MTSIQFLDQVVNALQKHKSSFTEIYSENLSYLFLGAVVRQLLAKKFHSISLDVRSSVSRENVIREAHRQQNNPKYYKTLDKAIWPENCKKKFNAIIYCLNDQGYINKKTSKISKSQV